MTRPVVPPAITDVVAPLGPNARAMLEDAKAARCEFSGCNRPRLDEFDTHGACKVGVKHPMCICRLRRNHPNCHDFVSWHKQPSPRPTVLRLLADTKAVILRRRQECYGGLAISDEQADELSRALVQHLLGSYDITRVAP